MRISNEVIRDVAGVPLMTFRAPDPDEMVALRRWIEAKARYDRGQGPDPGLHPLPDEMLGVPMTPLALARFVVNRSPAADRAASVVLDRLYGRLLEVPDDAETFELDDADAHLVAVNMEEQAGRWGWGRNLHRMMTPFELPDRVAAE